MGSGVIRDICPVTRLVRINDSYFELWFESKEMAWSVRPGQFFEIMRPESERLRIPISAFDVDSDNVGLMIKIVGDGTLDLSGFQEGEMIDVMGPLGNRFTLPEQSKILLVSGGIGYPPMYMLKKSLSNNNEITWIHGGRCKDDAFPCDAIYTDDGSAGHEGFVTIGVEEELASGSYDWLYACGPEPLLKRCAELAKQCGVRSELSLEAYMACGIGVCYGCAVAIKENEKVVFKTVCKDGPVFDAEVVVWK